MENEHSASFTLCKSWLRSSFRVHSRVSWAKSLRFFLLREFNGEINRGDHTVGPGESFAGNFESGSVIGAGAREGETERDVHASVKGVEFERDEALIVIHAESSVPALRDEIVKQCVGRQWTNDFGPSRTGIFRISDFGFQLRHGRCDDLDFFAPDFSRFAGVRIQSRHRDAYGTARSTMKKVGEQKTDTDNLRLLERAGNFFERNMRGDKGDRHVTAGQQHGEVFHAAALGEKFGLPGKFEANFIHSRLMNWTGNDGREFAAKREGGRFLKGRSRGPSGFRRRLPRFAFRIFPDHAIFRRDRQRFGIERGLNNLRADSSGVTEGDADAKGHRTSSSTPPRAASVRN